MTYLHARMRKVEESEKELSRLRVQDEQEYSSMKAQLESDVEVRKKAGRCRVGRQRSRSPWAGSGGQLDGGKAAPGTRSPQLFSVHSPAP